MPAALHGLAKFWYNDDLVKEAVECDGLGAMIKTSKDKGMAKKDSWHAIQNGRTVAPVILLMKDQRKLKVPYLPDIEKQVAIFAILISQQPVNRDTLNQVKNEKEVDLHLVSASIKKILGFLRTRFLKKHNPRDRGFET